MAMEGCARSRDDRSQLSSLPLFQAAILFPPRDASLRDLVEPSSALALIGHAGERLAADRFPRRARAGVVANFSFAALIHAARFA